MLEFSALYSSILVGLRRGCAELRREVIARYTEHVPKRMPGSIAAGCHAAGWTARHRGGETC